MKYFKAAGIYISFTAFIFLGTKGCANIGVLVNGGGTESEGLETMVLGGVIGFFIFLFVIAPIIIIAHEIKK